MTFWGKAITFFPLLHMGLILMTALLVIRNPIYLLLLPVAIYGFPLLLFRIHNRYHPIKEGKERLDLPNYSPWWTSHHFQALFNSFPSFETFLRLIPGVYSLWLRTWGSRIGRQVYWTPLVEIIDRNLVEVGDGTVFGHKVILVSHAITKKRSGTTFLYLKKVRIGAHSFIGAGSKFGPGTVIEPHQIVPFQTLLTINRKF
jgi:acetyltransferase-like isoleucine patch superfamily enzyme